MIVVKKMNNPTDTQRPANKRRKRKGSNSGAGANAIPPVPKKRSPGPNFSLASQVTVSILNYRTVSCTHPYILTTL